MGRDFEQLQWNDRLAADCRQLVRLALEEDLAGQQDWTTVSLVPKERQGAADIVTREAGVVAGLPALGIVVEELPAQIEIATAVSDGAAVAANTTLATLQGNTRDLLTCERTMLNLVARLMGIATLASRYVEQVQGTSANVYDTRKTTPGWRRLEKYAARCGGSRNHRTGLFDAILIKDNHLAQSGIDSLAPAGAVQRAREFLASSSDGPQRDMIVEIEVDTLEQFANVLPAQPDIVLLDNMTTDQLQSAVTMRNETAPKVQLEASGGVTLQTLREIATTGVDRISVGALTHSARSLDVGLDWMSR